MRDNMGPLFFTAAPVLVMFLVQIVCCLVKNVVVKLIPLAIPVGLFAICVIYRNQQTTGTYTCGMPVGILIWFLGLLLAGIAFGWAVYGVCSLIVYLWK